MKSIEDLVFIHVFGSLNMADNFSVLDAFLGLAPSPANLTHVDNIGNHILDRTIIPYVAFAGGNIAVIQVICNQLCTLPLRVEFKDLLHPLALLGNNLQSITLFTFNLYALIAIWGHAGYPFSFGCRAISATNKTAVDGFVLSATHKKAELEILLVKFVAWIVSLWWGNDFCSRILKYLADITSIRAVASGQSFQIDYEDTGINTGTHLIQ